MMEATAAGNDVQLMSKMLHFEHKLFYFDLKENPRGRFLKISEKTSATRSTIIVPVNGILWLINLFDYYVSTEAGEVFSKGLKIDAKVFFFDVGENKRGRFLKVSEVSLSRNCSTIIIPAGSSGVEGWAAFRNILLQINEETSRFFIPNKQHLASSEQLPELSDDVGDGFISGSGHSDQPVPGSDLTVDRLVEIFSHDEVGSMGLSKVIRAGQKIFFFDLGSNSRGHFLRISEVAGPDRTFIILPLSGLKPFHEMVGHFVEVTKEKLEGTTGPNARTLEPSRR